MVMATSRKLLFTSFFLASILLQLLFISPSRGENVTVSVYYETLCPYCADFIVNHLVKLFQKNLNPIVSLRMIPWGNAMFQPDGSVVCQHGPGECLLNTIEACAISIYQDVVQHFSFIHCVERLTLEERQSEWINCFESTRLGKEPINCYRNGYGKQLEQKYATETAQLQPPPRFVPWVVVNDQPLQEDFMNFLTYICKAYKGTEVPEGCRSLSIRNNTLEKAEAISVCYSGDVKNYTSAGPERKSDNKRLLDKLIG